MTTGAGGVIDHRSGGMRTAFTSREEFEDRVERLSRALGVDAQTGASLMARLAGFDSAQQVQIAPVDPRQLFSREELIARLQAERPDVDNESAARIINSLALPMRDGRLEDVPKSPNVIPNMGG
jgi:hypothetical protein